MSKISIKTDFVDGEKLFSQELNNNFMVIEEGINANEENLQEVIDQAIEELDNELEEITADRGWDWNGGDRVTFFKGTTSQISGKNITNGQLLYNTETGETALDDSGSRIVTGSGNVVTVADEAPTNPATKEWIKPTTVNGVATAEEYFRNSNNDWIKILTEPSGDTLPIGAIAEFGGSIAPTNWLFCNGQAVSRTEYAELFAIIGTNYGEGDGSTTFNLPDFIGRVPVGLDAEDTDFDELGDFGGEKTHTLTVNEMPSHTHYAPRGNDANVGGISGWFPIDDTAGEVPIGYTGNNQPHNIVQPYLVTNFIIKAKQSVGLLGTITTNIADANVNAVPNASTVKTYVDGLKPFVLWENPNISATQFTPQTVTLNSSNYDYLEVYYYTYNERRTVQSLKVFKGSDFELMTVFSHAAKMWWGARAVAYLSDTTLGFKDAYSAGSDTLGPSVTNDWMLPIKIVGYKY